MKTLRFGIVGCGRIAMKKHAPVLTNDIKDAELSAVCDVQEKRAKKWGEELGVPYYTDFHQMMKIFVRPQRTFPQQ